MIAIMIGQSCNQDMNSSCYCRCCGGWVFSCPQHSVGVNGFAGRAGHWEGLDLQRPSVRGCCGCCCRGAGQDAEGRGPGCGDDWGGPHRCGGPHQRWTTSGCPAPPPRSRQGWVLCGGPSPAHSLPGPCCRTCSGCRSPAQAQAPKAWVPLCCGGFGVPCVVPPVSLRLKQACSSPSTPGPWHTTTSP